MSNGSSNAKSASKPTNAKVIKPAKGINNATDLNATPAAKNTNNAKVTNTGSKPTQANVKERLTDDQRKCRIEHYDSFRKACVEEGDACIAVKKCKQYGVGKEEWPLNVWPLDRDQIEKIGRDNFYSGKECITMAWWEKHGKALEECGGQRPQFRSRNVQVKQPQVKATPTTQVKQTQAAKHTQAAKQTQVKPTKQTQAQIKSLPY